MKWGFAWVLSKLSFELVEIWRKIEIFAEILGKPFNKLTNYFKNA